MIPASKGFCITLKNTLENFKRALVKEGILQLALESPLSNDSSKQIIKKETIDENIGCYGDGGTSDVKSMVDETLILQESSTTKLDIVQQNETKRDSTERQIS